MGECPRFLRAGGFEGADRVVGEVAGFGGRRELEMTAGCKRRKILAAAARHAADNAFDSSAGLK